MQTQIIQGERISREGQVVLGVSGILFDDQGRIFLTRRADNGLWCLPGGAVDAGERPDEACVREFLEETCLHIRVDRLIGVYGNVDYLIIYPDGNRRHIISLHFAVSLVGGTPGLSDETTEWGYFTPQEIAALELLPHHHLRIADSFEPRAETLLR